MYDLVKGYEEQWFGLHVMPAIRKLITTNLINITLSGVSGSTANERRLTGEAFLEGLKASWEDHNNIMNMTTDILMYMDRIYCTDNRKPSIFTTAMGLFRDNILRSSLPGSESEMTVFDILNSVVLDQIEMERDGDVINKNLIKSCIYMLEGLYESDIEGESEKLYITVFEPVFLTASTAFYQRECASLLREADASSWLRQTRNRLLEEDARCQTTISRTSGPKIAKVVEKQMISAHLQEFLALEGSGIKAMIEHDRFVDLTALYQLITRVDPTKEPLKQALQARVVEMGKEINNIIQNTDFGAVLTAANIDAEAPTDAAKAKTPKHTPAAKATAAAIKWVDEVLKLKDKFDIMWQTCLARDMPLQTAITKSFADFINEFPRCSEYVSLFIDDNLKRGIKGATEAEIDVVLDKATVLLRFIQDRDMFERYYKKHLARRLLHGKSESEDVEKQMISRMKLEIGNSFTTKLDGMFKDMSMSEELSAGYRSYVADLGDMDRKPVDLGITVLTTNCWPMESMGGGNNENGSPQACTWPSNINILQESFKKFYLKERNGRKLTWIGYLGTADIKCFFPKTPGKDGPLGKDRRYELNVTTYGMLILMLFNDLPDGETLSFDEIQQQTNIPTNELIRNLMSLSIAPKSRVLYKIPQNKDTPKPGDTFKINNSFQSKAIKIKAAVVSGTVNKVEGETERKETEDRNDQSRGFVIDSVLVRIMKYVPLPFPLSFPSTNPTFVFMQQNK